MKKLAISSQRLWSIFVGDADRASIGPNLCLPVREFDEDGEVEGSSAESPVVSDLREPQEPTHHLFV